MRVLILLAALLVAAPSLATETWDNVAGTVNSDGTSCDFLSQPGVTTGIWTTNWCFFDAAQAVSETTVTTALQTDMCENIDFFCISEIGDDTTFINTCSPYLWSGGTISATDLGAILAGGFAMNGNPATGGDDSTYSGFSAPEIYVRFSTTEASTTSLPYSFTPPTSSRRHSSPKKPWVP